MRTLIKAISPPLSFKCHDRHRVSRLNRRKWYTLFSREKNRTAIPLSSSRKRADKFYGLCSSTHLKTLVLDIFYKKYIKPFSSDSFDNYPCLPISDSILYKWNYVIFKQKQTFKMIMSFIHVVCVFKCNKNVFIHVCYFFNCHWIAWQV